MFQYAFALATSKKLGTDFLLNEEDYSGERLRTYFALNQKPSILFELRKKFFYKLNFFKNVIEETGKNGKQNLLAGNKNNCIYTGFFQSEKYFNKYSNLIKEEFKIKTEHAIDIRTHLGINNDFPIAAVHVRRTDYQEFGDEMLGGKNLTLPVDYYRICLEQLAYSNNYNLVFVTDDAAFIEKNFANENIIISSNKNEIIDFQILMNADIMILANSSFSWWAAYLNIKAVKVFAPKYWLGFKIKKEYPKDIIPFSKNWTVIDFDNIPVLN